MLRAGCRQSAASRRTARAASLARLNDQGEAAAEVDFAAAISNSRRVFTTAADFAHGEDSHSGTQLFLECGAAGNHLVDLDVRAVATVGRGRSRTPKPKVASTSGSRRKLNDLDLGRLCLAVAIVIAP